MTARRVTECGLCGSRKLDLVLSLGASPPTCAMAPVGDRPPVEGHHPLELLRCRVCTLVQLSVVVDPDVVFHPEYPYSSGNSGALHENFEDLARSVEVGPGDLVVDIGANDGTLLSKFDGCRTVGVEPTRQAERIPGPRYRAFFTEDLARQIVEEHGHAKVVTACNVMAHVADLDTVMRGVNRLLAPDGVFVAENHDLLSVVDGQWDTVYHEHLRFYDPYSFARLLRKYGLGVESVQDVATHGGSFRTWASKRAWSASNTPEPRSYDFGGLQREVDEARYAIRDTTRGGGFWGIGATARATTIINYCGLDVEDVECVCEVAGSDKIGHYIPGTRIPVVDEARLLEDRPHSVLLLSWHLKDIIVPKLRERGYGGHIVVPLPELEYV